MSIQTRYLILTNPSAALGSFETWLGTNYPHLVQHLMTQPGFLWQNGEFHLMPEGKSYNEAWESRSYLMVPLALLGAPSQIPATARWSCQLHFRPAGTRNAWETTEETPIAVPVPAHAEFVEFVLPAQYSTGTSIIDAYIAEQTPADWPVDPAIQALGGPTTVPCRYDGVGAYMPDAVPQRARQYG